LFYQEKEKASKHSVELKILQEDVKILSRKYKETNVQLADIKAKYASLQKQEARREVSNFFFLKKKKILITLLLFYKKKYLVQCIYTCFIFCITMLIFTDR